MTNTEYPPQQKNPARELYNFWYGIVRHSAPDSLTAASTERHWQAAFVFGDGLHLRVDHDLPFTNGRPALNVPGLMRIWPNGYFQVHPFYLPRRATLDQLESHTFLRWGYVGRAKALWVQDTPRRGFNGAVNREYPAAKDYNRRVPYMPLTHPLFHSTVRYRLRRRNNSWVIVAHDPVPEAIQAALHSPKRGKDAVRFAQLILNEQYAIAENRYNWWEKREGRAAIREGRVRRPATEETELFTKSLVATMKVWEPKVGPGGVPYVRPDLLPLDEEEVLHGGTENDLAASTLAR